MSKIWLRAKVFCDSKILMNEKLKWVIGDAANLLKLQSRKSWLSIYAIPKAAESILRGFSQVCFANNPWTGLCALCALFVADLYIGLGALLATISALFMSKVLDQPDSLVLSGLQNYNAALVGCVTMSLFPLFFSGNYTLYVWCGVVLMSCISVCVGIGLGEILSPMKLPVYTLPFNIVTSLLFLSFRASGFTPLLQETLNSTEIINHEINWSQVVIGILKSPGQVYAIESITGSVLILCGLFLNSPLLTTISLFGSLLSSLTGLMIMAPPYSTIYAGIWGYNGFIAAGCIAFFVYPSAVSLLLALLNAIFAAFLHCGILPIFEANSLPVLTFPFCISSLLFLAMVPSIPGVKRVENLTFPEHHIMQERSHQEAIKRITVGEKEQLKKLPLTNFNEKNLDLE